MTAHGFPGEFDQLDAYVRAADAEALAALADRIDVEGRLRQLLHDASRQQRETRKPGRNDDR